MEHGQNVEVDEIQRGITEELGRAVKGLDSRVLQEKYWAQNEALIIQSFFPASVVEKYLLPELETVRPLIHRNYIPMHKKGGSVSYYTLLERAPALIALYRSPVFIAFLSRLVKAPLTLCPENDPHSCALYFYTEPGDHIGFHFDTSYYKGSRYTVLLGLIQQSEKCRLVYQFHKGDLERESEEHRIITPPGAMVLFNGDKFWHAISPLGEGEERVVLTMEYVTNSEMGKFNRFRSNMKDAIAYFGFSALLGKGRFKSS